MRYTIYQIVVIKQFSLKKLDKVPNLEFCSRVVSLLILISGIPSFQTAGSWTKSKQGRDDGYTKMRLLFRTNGSGIDFTPMFPRCVVKYCWEMIIYLQISL